MTFIWPIMFAVLLVLPVLCAVYLALQRRRRRMVGAFGALGLVEGAAGRRLGRRLHVPAVLFLVALAILIVALARPQTVLSLPRLDGTVILAFDVSGSMAANDLKPTRLAAAQAAARAFVRRQPPTVRIGMVAFSDGGFGVQAPTNDQDTVLAAIARLHVQRGTSLAQGIQASLKVITASNGQAPRLSNDPAPTPAPVPKGSYTHAVIVLLTDGENTDGSDPLVAAQAAANRGIRIYTVGIGSVTGATLHIKGFSVNSRLDEATLQQIAQLTGGTYYNAQSTASLRSIYDHLDPQLVITPQKTEVTSLFAGAGLLVLMAGGIVSLLWLGRLP